MIRILHLVPNLGTGSGVMSVIMNYYRNINKEKIQFDFCYFQEKSVSHEEEIMILGGKTFKISQPSISKSFKVELENLFESFEDNYIALHSHLVFLTFLFSPTAKKYGIKNIITHSHNTKYSDKLLSCLRNRLLKPTIKRYANKYFSCSKAAGEFLYGKRYLLENRVTIVNNAIDCEKFAFNKDIRKELRNELNLNDTLVIGSVGRFVEQKNHDFIVDIFYAIKEKKDNVKLVLVGDGPLEERIKMKVNKLNLEKDVIFTGRRKDVNDLMQAFDVFLLPSLFEGLPVVGVEAQASGLPIVMSDTITEEIGLGASIYLSLQKSKYEWANEILAMDVNLPREHAHELIGESGFDIKIEAKKLEQIYKTMDLSNSK